jgi:hypothetical protein
MHYAYKKSYKILSHRDLSIKNLKVLYFRHREYLPKHFTS